MISHFNSPEDVVGMNMKGGERKVALPLWKMLLLGIMAGAFIALGGAASNTAIHDIDNVGVARIVAGVIFPVGLMMIVFLGGELFTGNCLIAMNVMAGKTTVWQFMKNLTAVYAGNFLGALVIDILLVYSGNLDFTNGLLGAYTIKIAVTKVAVMPGKALVSGILCNVLVCVAILMATAAQDVAGKVWAIFFPICAFVIGGFEHCVANMFYIPAGMMAAANPEYAAKAAEVYGITVSQIETLHLGGLFRNLAPVTVGNMIGGCICIGGLCFFLYHSKTKTDTHKRQP